MSTPPNSAPSPRGLSPRAALFAVLVAFLVGLLASLALRPPGAPAGGTRAAGAEAAGEEPLHWRVAAAINTSLPALGDSIAWLADNLREATAGRIDLTVYEPGELVPAFGVVEAVGQGKIEAGFSWPAYDQGRIPAAPLIGAVPFGMEPWEFTAWWYIGGGKALGEALYHEHGVHPVLCGLIGPETAGWFRTPVTSIDDLVGLKIRFSGLGGQVLQRLGASVTMIPGGETFQALEKGVIDATEYSLPVVDQLLGFERIASFNYFPGWHQPFSATHLFVNLARWRDLAPATRRLLEVGCQAAAARSLALAEASQGPVLREFEAAGVTVGRLPQPLLERLFVTTEVVLDAQAAADPQFARILASQRAFRAAYAPWKRLAYLPRDFPDGAATP